MSEHPEPLAALFRPWTWLWQRGTPPPLRCESAWVRCVLAAVICGTLGLISAALSTLVYIAVERLQLWWFFDIIAAHYGVSDEALISWLILHVIPGICFGLLVLVPLSRWQGRGWQRTLWSIPMSGLIYGLMYPVIESIFPVYSFPIETTSDFQSALLAWVLAGGVAGLGIGVWMLPAEVRIWSACLLFPTAAGLVSGSLTVGVYWLAEDASFSNASFLIDWFSMHGLDSEFLFFNWIAAFHGPVAVALALRFLWLPVQNDRLSGG